jgi:hypothetical protein
MAASALTKEFLAKKLLIDVVHSPLAQIHLDDIHGEYESPGSLLVCSLGQFFCSNQSKP